MPLPQPPNTTVSLTPSRFQTLSQVRQCLEELAEDPSLPTEVREEIRTHADRLAELADSANVVEVAATVYRALETLGHVAHIMGVVAKFLP